VTVETARVGIGALVAHDVDEDAVTAFLVEPVNRLVENLIVVHTRLFVLRAAPRLRFANACSRTFPPITHKSRKRFAAI
jgi:hypothetical protein